MSTPAVSAAASAWALEIQREVSVMKKTRDVEKQAAESLIELVKQSPRVAPGRIDTYA